MVQLPNVKQIHILIKKKEFVWPVTLIVEAVLQEIMQVAWLVIPKLVRKIKLIFSVQDVYLLVLVPWEVIQIMMQMLV